MVSKILIDTEMFDRTHWHRSQDARGELSAMAPLAPRGTGVFLLWFDEGDTMAGQLDLNWADEWSAQPGLTEARAEIRLLLWNHVPPDSIYTLGTAHPQPTTRQQGGRDDIYVIGQLEQDREIAVLVVSNYVRRQQDQFHIRAVKTNMYSSREDILRNMAMTGMCEIVKCTVSTEGELWPHGATYPVYVGKRIDVEVQLDVQETPCGDQSEEQAVDNQGMEYGESEDETEDSVLMQFGQVWQDTAATHDRDGHCQQNRIDEVAANYERLYMDNGRTARTGARWDKCVTGRMAWVEPLRLRPLEMRRCWDFRRIDYVVEHFARQGLTKTQFQINGWLFRSFAQRIGLPFAWGISSRSPWHEQIASLMHGSQMDQGLMYTVVPQPPLLTLENEDPTTMQILTPFVFEPPDLLFLVTEHRLGHVSQADAISCPRPCTVFGVFAILGLSGWCEEGYTCIITYKHGTCDKAFQDLDQVEIPTASRVLLSAVHRDSSSCAQPDPHARTSRLARKVADTVAGDNRERHSKVLRSARRVLQHRSNVGQAPDETFLMQRPATHLESDSSSAPPTGSAEHTMEVSEISSQPPPVGPQPNVDVDWLHSWQSVRRGVADYSSATGRRQIGRNTLVHLLVCRQGLTTSIGVDCPDWILELERPIHLFTNWCQQFAFPFDVRYTRAFCSAIELYQNTPTIAVIDMVQPGHCPLVIQIVQARSAFCIYDAVSIERVAGIIQWATGRFMLLDPLTVTFNNRRVLGQEDIRIQAGDVLRIRPIPRIEMIVPEASTAEPDTSLGQFSHTTWSTMSELQQASSSSQDMQATEHTLMRPLHSSTSGHDTVRRSNDNEEEGEELEQEADRDHETDERSLLTVVTQLTCTILVRARISRDHITSSETAAQIAELSWEPEHNEDWIDTVARREIVRN